MKGVSRSITGIGDINYEVALGNVPGVFAVNKFEFNPDIDTDTDPEDLWTNGGLWVPPTQARVHNVVSTNANDTSAGTGARTITIFGLNANFDLIQEELDLNGTSNVATTNEYIRIYRMSVSRFGSSATNAGDITATAVTDATISAAIGAGNGQTEKAIYTIPNGFIGLLTQYSGFISRTAPSGANVGIGLYVRVFGAGGYTIKHRASISIDGNNPFENNFTTPIVIPSKSDVKLTCISVSDSNTGVGGGFNLIVVKQ